MSDTNADANMRRELGEVVGTLKMTVNAVDQLREGVEHLRESVQRVVERAAFKSDLEAVRSEFIKEIDDLRLEGVKANEATNTKIAVLQKWMWMGMGALAAIGAIGRFIRFPARIVFGGG